MQEKKIAEKRTHINKIYRERENNRIAIIQFGGNCHHFAQIQYETVGANRTSTVPIYSTIDFKISNE